MKSGRNESGIFQNMFKSHFGFETTLKSQFWDRKTDFPMFQVHILDLNVNFLPSHSLTLDLNFHIWRSHHILLHLNVHIEL